MSCIVYQTDKKTGAKYAYESFSFWDKEKKQSRSKRTLIGRVDPETGKIIPTDGRCKKLSPSNQNDSAYQLPKTLRECRAEILRLLEENKSLREQLAKVQK